MLYSLRRLTWTLALVGLLLPSASAWAQSNDLWGNNAGSGADRIEVFDKNTGTLQDTYFGQSGNGRGVVVIGNVIYYTVVNDPNIYMMDKTTGAHLGQITTAVQSMSTIAWDGSHFWTSDYSGTNRAFRIGLDGSIQKTITLSLATGFMDGMEYFEGKLIANRTDGGFGGSIAYDVYDLDGNVLQANFLSQVNGTGIAYDGTNFFVSDIRGNRVGVYSATGSFLEWRTLSDNFGSRLIEDLSVDYSLRDDIAVPEPATLLLLATGLFGVVAAYRRRRIGFGLDSFGEAAV